MATGRDSGPGGLSGQRVAVYARYSTDRQRETSLEDQVSRCRRFVEERGGRVVDELVFTDRATSGASLDRAGFEALMRAVDEERVDVVVAEDLSRISRDFADAAAVFKRLEYAQVPMLGVGDGIDTRARGSKLLYGLKSLVADHYLDELRDRTLRAMEERAREGLATGGQPLGFTAAARPDGKKTIAVDPEGARLVRRIFERYAAGESRAQIAAALNADGIDPPRSTRRRGSPEWRASTIRHVLGNERYLGILTFGAQRWAKAPGSNARRPQPRDASEVVRVERPELRIIEQPLWDAVRARAGDRGSHGRSAHAGRRGTRRRAYLLSGLLHCGLCGEPLSIHGGDASRRYYGCQAARQKGTCENRANVREELVRRRVLDVLRDRFLSAEAAAEVRALIAEELGQLTRGLGAELDERQARLRRTEDRIRGLLSFIADGDRGEYTVQALRDLEAQARSEKAAIAELRRERGAPSALPSPAWVLERFGSLVEVLDGDPAWGREVLGRLLDPSGIRITPLGAGRFAARMGVYPLVLLEASKRANPKQSAPGSRPSIEGIAGARNSVHRRVQWADFVVDHRLAG